jgi:hypothetical protein
MRIGLLFCATIVSSTLVAQLKIYPTFGFSSVKNRMVGDSYYIKAKNDVFSGAYFGFSLEKKLSGKLQFGFDYNLASIGLSYTTTDYVEGYAYIGNEIIHNMKHGILHKVRFSPSNSTYGSQTVISAKMHWLSSDIHLLKRSVSRDRQIVQDGGVNPRYFFNFSFQPFMGLGFNRVGTTNWVYGYPSDSLSGSGGGGFSIGGTDVGYFEKTSYEKAGDAIIKNRHGMSLQAGFRIQFKKQGKDILALNFIYSQGFVTMLESLFIITIDRRFSQPITPVKVNQTFASRGSFLAIYASYPITILNKKGERYRDRHPKM